MGKIALLFAGQGAQYPGMGKAFYDTVSVAKDIMDRMESKRPGTLSQCFHGNEELLAQTCNTQPCIFTVDYAIAKAVQQMLKKNGFDIACVAGFSLGEIPALAFSGMLSDIEAFDLVCKRAEWMHQAAEEKLGGMLAVLKLNVEQIEHLAEQYPEVYPVNYNSPQQTAVAGDKKQLQGFAETVKTAGGRTVPLAVSGAFHSPYMQSAADALTQYAKSLSIKEAVYPIYANRIASVYTQDTARSLIAEQVNHPVRWTDTIKQMQSDGVDCFVEVGPGKTLSGLVKKIVPDAQVYKVETPEDLEALYLNYVANNNA